MMATCLAWHQPHSSEHKAQNKSNTTTKKNVMFRFEGLDLREDEVELE